MITQNIIIFRKIKLDLLYVCYQLNILSPIYSLVDLIYLSHKIFLLEFVQFLIFFIVKKIVTMNQRKKIRKRRRRKRQKIIMVTLPLPNQPRNQIKVTPVINTKKTNIFLLEKSTSKKDEKGKNLHTPKHP